jgi:hypothetical protein
LNRSYHIAYCAIRVYGAGAGVDELYERGRKRRPTGMKRGRNGDNIERRARTRCVVFLFFILKNFLRETKTAPRLGSRAHYKSLSLVDERELASVKPRGPDQPSTAAVDLPVQMSRLLSEMSSISTMTLKSGRVGVCSDA